MGRKTFKYLQMFTSLANEVTLHLLDNGEEYGTIRGHLVERKTDFALLVPGGNGTIAIPWRCAKTKIIHPEMGEAEFHIYLGVL